MSALSSAITIRLGRRARARIAEHGLRPSDIAIVPAAAGGPKGLILHQFDCWLFGDFLPRAPRRRQFISTARMRSCCNTRSTAWACWPCAA